MAPLSKAARPADAAYPGVPPPLAPPATESGTPVQFHGGRPGRRRVLVACDLEPGSMLGLEAGARLAALTGGELLVLNVLAADAREAGVQPDRVGSVEPAVEARRSELEDQVRRLQAEVPAQSIVHSSDAGNIAEVIASVARARRVDIVVVTSSRVAALRGVLRGSVARRLLAIAPCPVVLVRR